MAEEPTSTAVTRAEVEARTRKVSSSANLYPAMSIYDDDDGGGGGDIYSGSDELVVP